MHINKTVILVPLQKSYSYIHVLHMYVTLYIILTFQVGACIVNSEHKIVGIGYNGMPNNCSDDDLPWQRDAPDRLDTKYPYGMCKVCVYTCTAEVTLVKHLHTFNKFMSL